MQVLLFVLAFAAVGAVAIWQSLAAPHNGGGGGGKHGTIYTGTFSDPILVLDNNSDGLPNWGDQITFKVTTTAPYNDITIKCSQNDTSVYGSTIGFGQGWPWPQIFTMQSMAWTSGAASCTAEFWASTSSGTFLQNMATKSFNVGA